MFIRFFFVISVILITGCQSSSSGGGESVTNEDALNNPASVFEPQLNSQWIGNGIAYSPYRDGESPDLGSVTSEANILEDLRLITQNWNLIRLYGAGAVSQRILKVIDENELPIKVLQGAWISNDLSANTVEVNSAIRLANNYPDIVVAVNIGNEMLINSAHKISDVTKVVDYIRQTKQAISQPVTVNEVYGYWNLSTAQIIVDEIDFISVHIYAFWDSQSFANSLSYTQSLYESLQKRYPSKQIVIGEAGWPSSQEDQLIRPGVASIDNLQAFFDSYKAWIDDQQIVSFYFAAFDENWKGGDTLLVEKHWGLFYAAAPNEARQPKISLP